MSYSFYKRDDTKVDFNVEEFVKVYEQSYYLHKEDCPLYIPRVSVNSRIAEKRADELLVNGIKKSEDVAFILAWKIGGINHIESEAKKKIVFKEDWQNNGFVKERYFKCERAAFNSFCQEVARINSNIETETIINEIIQAANDNGVKLGAVYILTLLYFITRKESPIFDRFAYIAAKSICIGAAPQRTWYEYPSRKTPEAILRVINEYKWFLTQVFGYSNISRSIDRALWVYGHMFYEDEDKKENQ